ncbi:hypothetical protein DL93DRAFT_969461 [Clavulina sp. PMI_390]|nr:hypothetical protein DL93DRAFT_969461 [Clavulina sp. PMI_390]
MDDIWTSEQCILYLASGNASLKRIRSLLSVNGILHGSRHDTLDMLLDRARTLLDDKEQLRRQLTTRFSDSHVIHQGHRDGAENHDHDARSDNHARSPPSQIEFDWSAFVHTVGHISCHWNIARACYKSCGLDLVYVLTFSCKSSLDA